MTKGCGAADSFSETCSAGRRLDHTIAGQEGLKDAKDLGGVPFCRALDAADHLAVAVDHKAGRQAAYPQGMPDLALGIDIDLEGFEPKLGDEGLDGLIAAAVFAYANTRRPPAEPRLQPLRRGHLAQARLAPGGPEID